MRSDMVRLRRLDVDALSIRRGPRTLFRGLTFSVRAGEAVALSGDNGAGKTSLLRAIAGLLAPSEGEIAFSADDVRLEAQEAIRNQTHLIGHLDGLAGTRSGRSEMEFATAWTAGSQTLAHETAERIGLSRLLELPISKLSAGQRRRIAMVRLISSPRPLWLLDEPNTSLDAATRDWLSEMMRAHLANGGLIVAAAHDPLAIETSIIEVGR